MTKAGSEKHRKLVGIQKGPSKEGPMPEDLYKKLVIVVYQLCEWGVPVNGALEIGRVIMDNYWREKNEARKIYGA